MEDYNVEAIKSIYKEDLLDHDNINTNYVLNNYYNNHIYFNAIQCPDKVLGKNGIHTFSFKRDNYTNNIGDNGNYVSYSKITNSIYNKFDLYKDNQIISSQDIDWDNAYLKYLDKNFIKSITPFKYDIIKKQYNEQLDKDEIIVITKDVTETPEEYGFKNETDIPNTQYVKTTEDLLKIIAYLLNRYQRLKRIMEIVKNQFSVINS